MTAKHTMKMKMFWIFMFNVVGTLQFYSVLESKRCFALKPATVLSTSNESTDTAWNTTAYIVNSIVDPAITFETLAFDKKVIIL